MARKLAVIENNNNHEQGDTKQKTSNQLRLRIDNLKTFQPLTDHQKQFFDSYKRGDYFVALHGVAGTGKTFIALYKAIEEVMDKSNPFNKIIVLDLKPQYAMTSGFIDTGDSDYGKLTLDNSSGFMLGSSVNFSLAKHWALSLNLDYLSTKFKEYNDGIFIIEKQDVSTFNTSLGFQFKF
jgi:hypothetical protein